MSCELVHKHLCTNNARIIIFLINEVIARFEGVKERHLQENNKIFKRVF
jgi:hypothetical protein